ncbi:MAG: mandelate racemase/muconate lactonizing enzyme family protein [Spirochaetia bacterium]|nr:mandelate racemase/muconate lactonizing enzyme family protein [Spirochaetia bacterium]
MSLADIKVVSLSLYYLPVKARVPLRFGFESMSGIECLRVKAVVENGRGRFETGWGEVPLNMQWLWPSCCSIQERLSYMKQAVAACADYLLSSNLEGHALDIGFQIIKDFLPGLTKDIAAQSTLDRPFPWSAALAAYSAFDIALHDAYGKVNERPVHGIYGSESLSHDLSYYLEGQTESPHRFRDLYPSEFLRSRPLDRLPVWHLVGGEDFLFPEEIPENARDDGYPLLLQEWIQRDGITCVKVKLLGQDYEWDMQRLIQVGKIALQHRVAWLSVDFNCTVNDPKYVVALLTKLMREYPRIFGMLLFVEQPFPAEIEVLSMDVHALSAIKPLLLDEGADHWTVLMPARRLGWSGVALKTCKTYTASILMASLAQSYGMPLMVQDLTNPMLAALSHTSFAAFVPTLMGFEANASQFYPEASAAEAVVHPGVYRRRNGMVSTESFNGHGFGYRIEEIDRVLPEPAYANDAHSIYG